MDLTSFYNTLEEPKYRNKYEFSSHYFNLGYKNITGRAAYNSPLPYQVKQFIMEYDEVTALPNVYKDSIVGFLLRPINIKTFRYYSEKNIPYGAGRSNKPYECPWVIVESCLDSDFLRQYYPYVIATLGVSVSNFLQDFLFSTAPYVIVGFDNDVAGNDAFKKMCCKYKGRVKKVKPPLDNKDFGDSLQHLVVQNSFQFDLESMLIQTSLQTVTGTI